MNRIFINFFFIIILFFCSTSFANDKIVYIDIEYIMANSIAGKEIFNKLSKKNIELNKKFSKIENDIKISEEKLLSQKNILKEEEFKKRYESLREKFFNYREDKKKSSDKLLSEEKLYTSKLLEFINPIVGKYSSDNSINLVLQKKNIVIGKKELDITNNILELINEKVKKIEIN
tara:strand:+ start:590 stop:1114 length:525 start_codon:yes stop_codon:yes gene_type:complete